MRIWLIKEGEDIPTDGENVRLVRVGILSDMLAKRGHEVLWWNSTFRHTMKTFRAEADTTITIAENYKIRLIHASPYSKNISFARIRHQKETARKFLQQAEQEEKPDVILVAMPTIDLTEAAVHYGKAHGVPVVVDIRDLWPDVFTEYFPKICSPFISLGTCKMNTRLRWALSEASGIMGFSKPSVEWGVKKAGRGTTTKDVAFPHSYQEYRHQVDIPKVLSQWRLYKNDFIVIYCGGISKATNLRHVLKTARLLQMEADIRFVILGDGLLFESFRSVASDLHNIFFPGRVDRVTLSEIATVASAGIIPYAKQTQFSTGYPNKFGEYLSFGLPVLLHTDGVMLQTIKEYQCGLPYDTPEQLADCIWKLKENPSLHDQIKQNARKLFEEKFEANKVYNEMMDYLESFVVG